MLLVYIGSLDTGVGNLTKLRAEQNEE